MNLDLPNWIAGDSVSAAKLNRMVDGIRSALPGIGAQPHRRQRGQSWEMFSVEPYTDTSVRVHAGASARIAVSAAYWTEMGIDGPAVSSDTDDYLTISGVTITQYIYLELDSATAPTTLTAKKNGNATWTQDAAGATIPIARVICTGGVIVEIEQLHTGVWWSTQDDVAVDDISVEFNTADELQIHGYNDGAPVDSAGFVASDLLPFHDADAGEVAWTSPLSVVASIADWTGVDLQGAAWTLPPWAEADAVSHHNLAGLNDDADDADHSWAWCNGSLGAGYTYDYTRNWASSIGRVGAGIGQLAIDLDNSELVATDAVAALDWTDLELRPRYEVEWTVTSSTNITPGTTTTGALQVVGGLSVGDDFQADVIYGLSTDDITPGDVDTGGFQADGGGSFAGDLQADQLYANSSVDYIPGVDPGAIITNGGIYAAKNIYSDGSVHGSLGLEIDGNNFWSPTGFTAIVSGDAILDGATAVRLTTAGDFYINGEVYEITECSLDIDGVPTAAKVLACLT